MAWDGVPWFTGGGAAHSVEVARLLAYTATSGTEGIVAPADLKVQPLAVPDGSVRVAPGACLVLNRAAGGSQQTYAARLPTEDVVAIAPTGSSGERTDMVVARVEDPNMAGEPWTTPADPAAGPYVFTRVLSNVPSSAVATPAAAAAYLDGLGSSAIPLAAVTLPVSTSTVTAAMITDLRSLAAPHTDRVQNIGVPAYVDSLTESSWRVWPNYRPAIRVPAWATGAFVRIDVANIALFDGSTSGHIRAVLNGSSGGGTGLIGPEIEYFMAAPADAQQRFSVVAAARFDDVTSLAGTTVNVQMEARRNSDAVGSIVSVVATQEIVDVQFFERIL